VMIDFIIRQREFHKTASLKFSLPSSLLVLLLDYLTPASTA
jgi:hypothetical protein